jgi:hypothetical protein
MTDGYVQKLGIYNRFDSQPSLSTANGYSDPTGTTGNINRAMFREFQTQYHVKGTQTLLGPLLDVDNGLEVSQDQTDNDGVEHLFGALGSYGQFSRQLPHVYDLIDLDFKIADVSGTDDCCIGFRKVEAFQANVDDYADACWVNINLGDVLVESMVGGAATVTTDSGLNWLDGETHRVTVKVVDNQVICLFDGVPLPGIPAYSFTATLDIVPFFFFLQATTSPGKVWWKYANLGLSSETTSSGDAA